MKKVFAILAIAATITACNNEAETGMSAEDSARIADSTRDAMMKDSMDRMMADTSHNMDSMLPMPDSLKK